MGCSRHVTSEHLVLCEGVQVMFCPVCASKRRASGRSGGWGGQQQGRGHACQAGMWCAATQNGDPLCGGSLWPHVSCPGMDFLDRPLDHLLTSVSRWGN